MKNKAKKIPIIGIIVKTILIIIVLINIGILVECFMDQITDYNEEKYNKAESIRRCDDDYHEKNYGSLRETLTLYDLYDDIYDKYWEIANGYEAYQNYLICKMGYDNQIDGAYEEMQVYAQQVKKNAQECKFDDNKKVLEGYAKDIQ